MPLLMLISGVAFIGSMGATFYQASLIAQTPASSTPNQSITQSTQQQTGAATQQINEQRKREFLKP